MSPLFLMVFGLGLVGGMPVQQKEYMESIWTKSKIGDVVFTQQQKFMRLLPENARMKFYQIDDENRRWPNNVVPYVITRKHPAHEHRKIRRAMDIIEAKTCFKFVLRTNQEDYLSFAPEDSCWSYLGRIGGGQRVSLRSYCFEDSVDIHEIMHALGVDHEHTRPDRDNYIDVHLGNVEAGSEYLYDKSTYSIDSSKFPYDLHSIMHYYSTSYAKPKPNGRPKIVMTLKGTNTPVPTNKAMSREDVRKLNQLGNCSAQPSRPVRRPARRTSRKQTSRRGRGRG